MSSSVEILQGRQEAVLEEKQVSVDAEQKGKGKEPREEEGTSDAEGSGAEEGDHKDGEEVSEGAPAATAAAASTPWQAVWSPEYGAYYFFNAATQETTWVNPLQPEASTSGAGASASAEGKDEGGEGSNAAHGAGEGQGEANAGAGSSTGPQLSRVAAQLAAMRAAAEAQGIDPLLAHLDPTLMQGSIPGSSGPSDLPTFKAQFNARTGQFAPVNSRTPGHLSEFERAKRMSEFYFDVGKWEEDLAKRGGRLMGEEGEEGGTDETGKKRKRPTKKDIERFKEQKRLKKIAKTAWLRT